MIDDVVTLATFIQRISTEPRLTVGVVKDQFPNDLVAEIGTKRFCKTLVSLCRQYRVRACIFAGTVLLRKKFVARSRGRVCFCPASPMQVGGSVSVDFN